MLTKEMRAFIRAADELVNALVNVRRADRFIVDGPGSRKYKAHERAERAQQRYDDAKAAITEQSLPRCCERAEARGQFACKKHLAEYVAMIAQEG